MGGIEPSRADDPRKPLIQNADIRKGLIILQENVVLGLMGFNQVVFQQEGIKFRIGDGK
jgi:hypothetical protein